MSTLTTTQTTSPQKCPQKCPQNWRLSWNATLYDYEGRIKAAQNLMRCRIFWQSWGNRSLKSISKVRKNDVVYITCQGYCVAKGRVLQPFAKRTIDHDNYSKVVEGDERHANGQFCQILLE